MQLATRDFKMLSGSKSVSVYLYGAVISLLLGYSVAMFSLSERSVMAMTSIFIVIVVVAVGRSDVTRPFILLPILWFSAVAVVQLKLLHYEGVWSTAAIFLIYACPLAFSFAAWVFGGGAKRPCRVVELTDLSVSRMRLVSLLLIFAGLVGLALKAQLLGGIPLLSDSIDELRSAGGIKISAYITFLTNCFFLGAWLACLSVLRNSRRNLNFEIVVITVGILGVASSASRNTLLLTILVPFVFCYQTGLLRSIRGKKLLSLVGFAALSMLVVSGLFFFRTGQHEESAFEKRFYAETVETTPALLRPLLPVYVGLAAPFESLNRLVNNPSVISNGTGTYSMPGVPPRISPFGPKRDFYALSSSLSRPYYFNVATYIGGFFADGGRYLALLASLILGALFGLVWRIFAGLKPSVIGVAITSYSTYLVGFLIYENLIGFYTLAVVWDIAIIVLCLRFSRVQRSSHSSNAAARPVGVHS